MLIIDGHQDIAFNIVNGGRDFLRSVAQTRALEPERTAEIATNGLPDALAGGVRLVFATLFVAPARAESLAGAKVYRTAAEAHTLALEQLAVYRQLAQHPQITLVQSRADLDELRAAQDAGAQRLGIVLLMEGADPIVTPDQAGWWYEQGVRFVGPAWSQTRFCGGTGAPGPLTPLGRALMPELSRAGLTLDVSHLAEQSFWQALELYDGPLIASHSNCRALVPGDRADRHLSDEMIRALVERDAVIGAVLYNRFIKPGWSEKEGKSVTLADLVAHIDRICQIAGNTRHVAIGSDLDGGLGRDEIPAGLNSIADLAAIGAALRAAGYTEADADALLGGNWLRVLQHVLV